MKSLTQQIRDIPVDRLRLFVAEIVISLYHDHEGYPDPDNEFPQACDFLDEVANGLTGLGIQVSAEHETVEQLLAEFDA